MKAKQPQRLCLSIILLLACGVSPIAFGPAFAGEPIKATIEFSRSLPALGDEYKEGAPFALQAGKKAEQTLKWRRVPRWLAGVWHMETTTRKVFGIPVSYPTKGDFISGYQTDAKGHVWHPIIKRVSRIDSPTYYEFQIPQGEEIFDIDRGSSTRFTRSIRVRVNKANGRIIMSFQQEDIAVTRPVEDGVVEVNANCRVFDKTGAKLTEQNISVVEERVGPYHAIDTYGGVDFVGSLNEYLKTEGKADLVASPHEVTHPDERQAKILANEDQNSKLMEGVVNARNGN